jgi:hypothetical protein
MQPTKCYQIGSNIVTDAIQLHFLLDYFKQCSKDYGSDCTDSINEIKRTLNEGLENQPLLKEDYIINDFTRFPDLLIEVKEGYYQLQENGFYRKVNLPTSESIALPLVKSIISIEIEECQTEYQTKKIFIECAILFKNQLKKYFIQCSIKDDEYWAIYSIKEMTNTYVFRGNQFMSTYTVQTSILHQILNNRIHLALSGHGYLYDLRSLPIVSFPEDISPYI